MSSAAYRRRHTDITFPTQMPDTAGRVFPLGTARGRPGLAFSEPTVQKKKKPWRAEPEVSPVIKAVISNKRDWDMAQ